jgi:restriction system protein
MGLWRVLERFFSSCRLEAAVAAPIAVFIVLNLAAQIVILNIWSNDQPFLHWAWSAVVIPLLAFVVAFLVTIVAVAGQFKRTGWWRLLESNQSLGAIRSLSWRDFERVVAAAFTQRGWTPELVGQSGPDGGIDLVLQKGKQSAIVQCKQRRFAYGAYVGERDVREFVGVIAQRKAMKGFLVTSGVFTPEATQFAEKVPQLELIAGDDLLAMVGRCPKCKGPVAPKHGKHGVFLSCVRYPDCAGALNLAA